MRSILGPRRRVHRSVLLFGAALAAAGAIVAARSERGARPNILLIVADDLGYADLGPFGSDIRTPNLDRLAAEGLLFTHFHTAPMCAPTRAMLLTGNNNHVAGMGQQSPPAAWSGTPGYEGYLSDRVAPFPALLRQAGYHTYSTGKWHLGNAREQSHRRRASSAPTSSPMARPATSTRWASSRAAPSIGRTARRSTIRTVRTPPSSSPTA